MRMVPDRTGRFRERPHYDARDLDVECEGAAPNLLSDAHFCQSAAFTGIREGMQSAQNARRGSNALD